MRYFDDRHRFVEANSGEFPDEKIFCEKSVRIIALQKPHELVEHVGMHLISDQLSLLPITIEFF